MRKLIPAPVVAAVAEMLSQRTTHVSLDNLFMHAGAAGEPPEGSKWVKAQEWMRRVNRDETVQPLGVLGRLIETYMEEEPPEPSPFDKGPPRTETDDQEKIRKSLARYDLQYVSGGLISGTLGTPSKALEDYICDRDLPAVDHEFSRALANVEHSPREAVSAASNILESICKLYIAEQGLDAPQKQDLKAIWSVVRKDLGFDPSEVEDKDLQVILTGLFAIVEGIGALRTHTSSAHGAGKKQYKLQSRHARLAIHSAHTVALFILETWQKKVS